MRLKIIILLIILLLSFTVSAQELPQPIPQQAMYIPFPSEIALDGNLDDWANIPSATVTTGPYLSPDPAENGSFTFAVAGDAENVYLYMTMPDATIVTGQHEGNYWNEDSMEFYLNFTEDIFREDYTAGVYQININPGDIGNTDPAAITVTGSNSGQSGVQAFVFATDDGWGFEALVPYPEGFVLEHGREIGLQTHANGSSGGDRDVKLIWSAADEGDTSWQDPSVFGIGIFYEIGREDVPLPSDRTAPVEIVAQQHVSINQTGYHPNASKFGMLANRGNSATIWSVIDVATDEVVLIGQTTAGVEDSASGDTVQIADFSELSTPGTYRLRINDIVSDEFIVSTDIYNQLPIDSARYFYLNRSGIELTPEFAGEDYARPAGHMTDDNVTCYQGIDAGGTSWDGCDYTLNVRGGWYDAGDYGKYVVNGGISVWTLMNLYERLPDAFPDGSLNIPESGNGVSDILDEARWQMEFLMAMQVPEGAPLAGMVHHKVHDLVWEGMPVLPPTEYDNNNDFSSSNSGRYLYPPSTGATYNVAATAAQCARIWREIDPEFADRCLNVAMTAFDAGMNNPIMLAGNTPGAGGGNYDDNNIVDELYWAAAELYITTGDTQYLEAMESTPYAATFGGLNKDSAMYWGDTAALGALSLVLHNTDLPDGALDQIREQIASTAETYWQRIASGGYRVPIEEYPWGSNSGVLNNAIILSYGYDITGNVNYLNAVAESMDYLMGRNALAFSYISGYGERAMTNPHHRFWGNQPANGFPAPPPGVVAGGPNANPSDPTALEEAQLNAGPARRYVDLIGSWSTNEVTINWNAPLVWVTAYLNSSLNQ